MNKCSFVLETFILKSNYTKYPERNLVKLIIRDKIGEGSYGIIYLIENDSVIKIFKNSTINNAILEESKNLIPSKNENRELIFFLKYIIDNKIDNKYIINVYAIGVIKDIIIDNKNELTSNSYFIILPYCIPFYNSINILNVPLIQKKDGIIFTLKIMKRMLEVSYFLENKYNMVNLDIKLNNFVFKKSNSLKNLIMIDFSLLKTITNKKYNFKEKYYIWPNNSSNFLLENIPAYSTCINGLSLLFGHDKISKEIHEPTPTEIINKKDTDKLENSNNKIDHYLKILKEANKNVYNIFFNGLMLRINTGELIDLIDKFLVLF